MVLEKDAAAADTFFLFDLDHFLMRRLHVLMNIIKDPFPFPDRDEVPFLNGPSFKKVDVLPLQRRARAETTLAAPDTMGSGLGRVCIHQSYLTPASAWAML